MRDVQHKYLPHLACMTPMALLFKENVVNLKKNPKFQKSFPLVCRACRVESIDIAIANTLKFDQYSHHVIRLNIFRFSAINSKTNFKFEKVFHQFAEIVKTNPLIYNTLQFDQCSRLAIRLNIFLFSDQILKTNLKFEKINHQFVTLQSSMR